ncbi:fimbrial biogenesis chaperone [Henriciella aquimarina]|uniref:hypothetical protein n=1 Tax=Henriciella aquimarina TaxID=545261 RepID=UPI00117AC955|nr:hypothetical protein [Henriciella aquimarina]
MRLLPALQAGLLSLAVTAFAAPPAMADPDLQPGSIEIFAKPGERQRHILTLTNPDDAREVSLTLGMADWTLARDGQVELEAPGLSAASADDWVRFSPAYVTLAPGEARDILVDVIVPAKLDAPEGRRTALLASAIVPDSRPGAEGLKRRIRVASLFYLTPPGAVSAPDVRDLRVSQTQDGPYQLTMLVENAGNAHARLEGDLVIEGRGETVRIPVSNLVVLNGREREFTVPLPETLPGRARVSTHFTNIHAPQAPQGEAVVDSYSAPLGLPDE